MNDASCPCLSGQDYQHCCAPLHQGSSANNAEQLMRARYSAFYLGKVAYLIATLHPDSKQADDEQVLTQTINNTQWLGLRIVEYKKLSKDEAKVEFIAFYHDAEDIAQLHERSHFLCVDGQWLYVDGAFLPPVKLGRNEPCLCGSGKKMKHCHLS